MTAPNHPRCYASATWRGLTAPCASCGAALLSFHLPASESGGRAELIAQLQAGEPLRLLLSAHAVGDLAAALSSQDHASPAGLCPTCLAQPEIRAGKPTEDGSMQGGGQNV